MRNQAIGTPAEEGVGYNSASSYSVSVLGVWFEGKGREGEGKGEYAR